LVSQVRGRRARSKSHCLPVWDGPKRRSLLESSGSSAALYAGRNASAMASLRSQASAWFLQRCVGFQMVRWCADSIAGVLVSPQRCQDDTRRNSARSRFWRSFLCASCEPYWSGLKESQAALVHRSVSVDWNGKCVFLIELQPRDLGWGLEGQDRLAGPQGQHGPLVVNYGFVGIQNSVAPGARSLSSSAAPFLFRFLDSWLKWRRMRNLGGSPAHAVIVQPGGCHLSG